MKKHLTIRLDDDDIKAVKAFAIKNNTTVSEIIRKHIFALTHTEDWIEPPALTNGWKETDPNTQQQYIPIDFTIENGMVKNKDGKVLFCLFKAT